MMEQKTYMNQQLKAILKRNRVLEVRPPASELVFCTNGILLFLRVLLFDTGGD